MSPEAAFAINAALQLVSGGSAWRVLLVRTRSLRSLAFSGTGVPCAPETWRWSLGWMEREHQVDLCGRD